MLKARLIPKILFEYYYSNKQFQYLMPNLVWISVQIPDVKNMVLMSTLLDNGSFSMQKADASAIGTITAHPNSQR